MSPPLSGLERAYESPMPLPSWRQRLFNWLARWEEASLARSLGLPLERVNFVDVPYTALRSGALRPPDAVRASDAP